MHQAAVIVNEFGEIGLDYDLVERSDENVVQLANGCLCCSVKGDLIDTFRDLYIQRNAKTIPYFNRVVIETTGIADPAPILQLIFTNPMIMNHYTLDGVVTTIDAINGDSSLKRFPECVKQAAIADRLIITKSDLAENNDYHSNVKALIQELNSINPAAPIFVRKMGDVDPNDLFGTGMFNPNTKQVDFDAWIDPDQYASSGNKHVYQNKTQIDEDAAIYYKERGHIPDNQTNTPHNHDGSINTFCIVREEPMSLEMLRMFFEGISNEKGPDLLRVKGIISVEDNLNRPAIIQGAQQIFHSLEFLDTWPSEDKRTRIVFITRGIERNYIEDTLKLIERVAQRTVKASHPNLEVS